MPPPVAPPDPDTAHHWRVLPPSAACRWMVGTYGTRGWGGWWGRYELKSFKCEWIKTQRPRGKINVNTYCSVKNQSHPPPIPTTITKWYFPILWTYKQCCGTVPFCLGSGSGSGSQICYPRFRLRFRLLPSNFKLFFSIKPTASYLDFCFFSRQLHACVGQYPVRVDLVWYFFLQREPEPEPRLRIRFRFRFFLGQNDTVPAVPVPAPVPQHCIYVTMTLPGISLAWPPPPHVVPISP
jgi:hypothetical protein